MRNKFLQLLVIMSTSAPSPSVPMSSISPSHKEPPMWAQRLSLVK